ncbi:MULTISPECIES: NAD-dependent epimerase/dehydratase family protein [unclassified Bradyrhizobium]
MTVWVTGANGFIGRYLTRALADAGHLVSGVGHGALGEPERQHLGLRHWLNGEIEAANLHVLSAQTGVPTIAFHLAGGSSVGASIEQPFEDFSRTVIATARFLDWMRTTAPECRLVIVSSAAVYGAAHKGPIPESALTEPVSPYGEHKLMIEHLCRSYARTFGLRSTIVRLFSVYGANLRKQLLWDLCLRLRGGVCSLTLGGTGKERRDWIEIRDVARLLVRLGSDSSVQSIDIVNGGSGIATTVADVAQAVVDNWGGRIPVEFSGSVRAGDPFSLVADTARLNSLHFDWRIPYQAGIADYVTWFKEQFR